VDRSDDKEGKQDRAEAEEGKRGERKAECDSRVSGSGDDDETLIWRNDVSIKASKQNPVPMEIERMVAMMYRDEDE
jgi:hypothetical protein